MWYRSVYIYYAAILYFQHRKLTATYISTGMHVHSYIRIIVCPMYVNRMTKLGFHNFGTCPVIIISST